MLFTPAQYAAAIWTHPSRTLDASPEDTGSVISGWGGLYEMRCSCELAANFH